MSRDGNSGDMPVRVLHVCPSFYPATAFGGPIFSTLAITDYIAQKPGFLIEVLTTDAADPNTRARLEPAENPVKFPRGYFVRYCRRIAGQSVSTELLWRLVGAIRRADVVHITGPYNFPVIPTLVLSRLTGTPVVWSSHGGIQATEQWRDAPKQRIKRAFERVCAIVRPRRTVMHVTAGIEADICAARFGGIETALIPNSVDIPAVLPARKWRAQGRLQLGFLSRIHPKKGLELLFQAMALLPEYVMLDIYGEGDPAYIDALRVQIGELGLSQRVHFRGFCDGDAKTRAFCSFDVFVLPTHSENFGIVVAEALAHQTPVLTTKNAPWAGLEQEECGLWIEAGVEAITNAINTLDGADLPAMGARGRDWVMRDFSTAGMAEKFASLYRRLGTGE